jgi:general secretion pathway protein G
LKLIEQIEPENGLSCANARNALRSCRLCDKGKAGFTLVELLVVVVIIAILAAFLFPLADRAMDKARMSKCVSQLRTIGQGLNLYAAERDMRFPGIGQGSGSRWLHQIGPYVGFKADQTYFGVPCYSQAYKAPLFSCPMVARWILPSGSDPSKFTGYYGLNRNFYDNSADPTQPSCMYGYSRLIVRSPAKTVMVAESCTGGPGAAASSYPDQRQDTGISANHRSDRTPSKGPDGPSNYLFVDGHVETLTKFIGATAFDPTK